MAGGVLAGVVSAVVGVAGPVGPASAAPTLPGSLGLAATGNLVGGTDLFGLDSAGHLFERTGQGLNATFTGWTQLDGVLTSVTASLSSRGVVLAGVNSAGTVFVRRQTSPLGDQFAWTPWAVLDGSLSKVALSLKSDGTLLMAGLNATHQVFVRSQAAGNPDTWTPWAQLDGLLSDIAAAPNNDGTVTLAGINSAGTVFYRTQTAANSSTWHPWTQLDGALTHIALTTSVFNAGGSAVLQRLHMFGVNSGQSVFTRAQTSAGSTTWTAWNHLDGLLTQITAASTFPPNGLPLIFIFGVNAQGTVFVRSQDNINDVDTWTAWRDIDTAV